MNAFYQDMIELALASVLAPFVSVLPGMALLWLGEKAGWARRGGACGTAWRRARWKAAMRITHLNVC